MVIYPLQSRLDTRQNEPLHLTEENGSLSSELNQDRYITSDLNLLAETVREVSSARLIGFYCVQLLKSF